MEKIFGRRRKAPVSEMGTVDQEIADGSAAIRGGGVEKRFYHSSNKHQIFNHNGHKVARGIRPEGESGRRGVHPWHVVRICYRSTSTASMAANVLWPFVPPAIVLHFARPDQRLWIFILNYIAMVPSANLIGFAAQELGRKLPKVFGRPLRIAPHSRKF